MRSQRNITSPFYAYCVLRLEPEQGWSVFPGVGDRAVFPVREGKLAMLVSRLEKRFNSDAHSIIQHGRVVHQVFERNTVLPFRFGTTFKTEAQIRQVLVVNRGAFMDSLTRLRGKAEMHVKVLFAATGARAKAAAADTQSDCVREATDRVAGLFDPLEQQVSVRALQNGEWLVDFAHLVEDTRVPAYQKAHHTVSHNKDCQIIVSGPWPPYHFLPAGIRIPAASEALLQLGRRLPKRQAMAMQSQAAKA